MPFPFPESDDYLDRYTDPDPVECCRHEIPVSEHCPQCALDALERFKARYAADKRETQARLDAVIQQARRAG